MRLLMIEDQDDFVAKVRIAVKADGPEIEFLTAAEVGLDQPFTDQASYEEQLFALLKKIQDERKIDLVLLDSDLSRMGNGIAQSMCRQAFQELGVPVCRYKKKHSDTQSNRLQDLKRIAREGASAVWVPPELVKLEKLPELVRWLVNVEQGFSQLRQTIEGNPKLLSQPLGPAGILSLALGRPAAKADFLGYTAQNFFFFGAPLNEDESQADAPASVAVQATRLGYWLINYILLFPGPILSPPAAAAYLNLQLDSFGQTPVQEAIKLARYEGPFRGLSQFYWRDELGKILDGADGDIATLPAVKAIELKRVDDESPGASAYLCVLTQQPIADAAAALNPDWIPAGANVARISQDLFDKIDPMLSA